MAHPNTMMSRATKQEYPLLPENLLVAPFERKDLLELFPIELIKEFEAFVADKNDDGVKIGAINPDAPELQKFAKERWGEHIQWFSITPEQLATLLKSCPRDFSDEIRRLTLPERGTNGNITEIIDRLIDFALADHASDIHIEPLRSETAVRFRLDGVLHTVATLPKELHSAIVARVKILSDLRIDEYRRPQDGRIELENLPDVSLRISTVPTLYGEKIAMRVLDETNKEFKMAKLGFSSKHEDIIRRNAEKPFGMIVTSGPTGSGKTTTLYGMLYLLRREGINISTLEDPIEYALEGINQIQTNPRVDLTFATGLRSLLRQDPDVIMVGEIRDSETAVMAANAALTGHLVLTTMHTNDAPSAFTRLMEMHVEDFVVGSVVNLVIAQRLVRKICSACKKEKKLHETIVKKIEARPDVLEAIRVGGTAPADLLAKPFTIGTGCDLCLGTGYAGRVGMFELLELNKDLHDCILARSSAAKIRETAMESGFRTMLDDGIRKIRDGQTTFDEVLRVTRQA